MFGEGTDPENSRRTYFPVTRGFALDNGGNMTALGNDIHGAPKKRWRMEDCLEGPHLDNNET